MGSMEKRLVRAVRIALTLAAIASSRPMTGKAAERPDAGGAESITVLGSRIPDAEQPVALPLFAIDRSQILATGKATLGDVLQQLPMLSGKITNPRVNAGGGTGAATLSLHGLGTARTLLLVDGRRVLNNDVNAIPLNAVERIEVLSESASTVFGSDAVAGVVNVVLRHDYEGAEFSADYGISDRGDGARHAYRFAFGQTTDHGSIVAGVDYNRQDSIPASSRRFSRDALYFYYGAGHAFYSNRMPTGLIALPANLRAQFGCPSVTLKQLGSAGTSLDDYRCYTTADGFNYQANGPVIVTPQERTNAFVAGNYRLGDSVETYVQYYHDKTQSASSIAPQSVDTLGSALVISKDNYYNPFGVEFSNLGFRFKTRTTGNGDRITHVGTTTDRLVAGFDGKLGSTGWHWNAWFDYSHASQLAHTSGYLDPSRINAQLGPSYRDASGQIVCGTPASGPVPNCTPVNLFAVTAPATVAALASASIDTFTGTTSLERSAGIDFDGPLLQLPAGAMEVAAGIADRRNAQARIPDATGIPDAAGFCVGGSSCVPLLNGAYRIDEAYAQLRVPVLRDKHLAKRLDLTLGERYSRSSAFASTSNARVALDWRPVDDLLLHASVTDVFHAPTPADLYEGQLRSVPYLADRCYYLIGSNPACVGVPGDGSFYPIPLPTNPYGAVTSGARDAGVRLRPEHGRSFDYGIAYGPAWLPALSLRVDLWHQYVQDEIRRVNAQEVLDTCFYYYSDQFCHLIHRRTSGLPGLIDYVQEPIGNLGRIDADGVDLAAVYGIPQTAFGNFTVAFQASYLNRFGVDPAPGLPGDFVRDYAGRYANSAALIPYANFPRWKALAVLNWNRGSWSAAWTIRYIGRSSVGFADPTYNESPCASYPPGCELHLGATAYHNVSAGYDLEALNARIDVGIDNLGDRQPPLAYQTNSPDNNVDATTFDTLGRFYWARVSVRF